MAKIKSVGISYWFKKLDENPSCKIKDLEGELESLFHTHFLYNDKNTKEMFGMPRIQVLSNDKKYFFTMSLINANLIIDFDYNNDIDNVILEVNKYLQLFYDTLKEIYHLHIVYTSIKVEIIDERNDGVCFLSNKFSLPNDCESLSFKKSITKDDYYLNYSYDVCKEYNFNLENNKLNSQDIIDSTMLISLSEATKKREYLLIILEINDRFIYNLDVTHETSKETLRGMILELKSILKEEI